MTCRVEAEKRMRSRLGDGFKRCVKFDDDIMRLYLDIKLPESPEWMSITPEIAQEVKLEDDRKKTDYQEDNPCKWDVCSR